MKTDRGDAEVTLAFGQDKPLGVMGGAFLLIDKDPSVVSIVESLTRCLPNVKYNLHGTENTKPDRAV